MYVPPLPAEPGGSLLPPPRRTHQAAMRREILVACPWTPAGGGMYKVADYLIRAQGRPEPGDAAAASLSEPPALLRPLDTRSGGSAFASLGVLALALGRLARGRMQGRVAGVHVNMAERLSLVRKSAVIVACRVLGLPVVLHLHAAQLHRGWPRFPAPVRALVRWVFSLPAACIVLGRQSADFVSGPLRVPADRVIVVNNGVPAPAQSRQRRARDGLQLLFVGNLSERKGVHDLLQAMAQAPLSALPVTLTLAGGGDLAHWQTFAERLGLGDRVRFTGWMESEGLGGLMAQADALVLPSYDEGLPLAILEALAQGLPVVCTPVGEIADHLDEGRHALFVPPGDPRALARTLARLLLEPRLRERLALEGRALWQREFSMERFFARIAAVHARCFGTCAALPPAKDGV